MQLRSSCCLNRLPEKGPATGSIIGGIIAVILVLAIIGTAIAMWRKHKNKKLGDRPPKYKPPPPQKANSSVTTKLNQSYVPEEVSRSVPNEYYYSQSRPQEPITDLDAYLDDDNNNDSDDDGGHDGEHYFPASHPGWDDPGNSEILPPYRRPDSAPQDYNGTPNVSRGESFVSTPMIV